LAAKHRPPNGYAAKFSLPYLIGVILVKGRAGLAEFTDEAAGDEAVLGVASRVSYEVDPSIDYPRQFIGHVAIHLHDGRVLEERQDRPRGGPDLPMSQEEIEAKFRGNATLALSDERASRIIETVAGFEKLERIDTLMKSLIT
jgi:2-methylcitrate dehydratase PrpD